MSADIASIRARIAAATPGPWTAEWSDDDQWWQITGQPHDDGGHWLVCPEVATSDEPDGTEADLIAHAPADLAALCDEVEVLREKLGRRRMHALYRATKYGRITGRSEMDAYGRSLGHALVKEIQERRKTAETSDDLAQGWYETEVDLHDALDREAELTADLYELRQQRREASEVWQ